MDANDNLHEGQGGFRRGRSCIDDVFSLNDLIQGCIKENKATYAFFVDVKKAYDMVWRNGLWVKMWEMGIRGKIWRTVRSLYLKNRSCIHLEGKNSVFFFSDFHKAFAVLCLHTSSGKNNTSDIYLTLKREELCAVKGIYQQLT